MTRYDVAVIGLGAYGSAATWQLARRGARVLGLDRFAPPHAQGSTHGESRITRMAVGEGLEYTPLALRSRGLGSCYTTLHLGMEAEANELLGVPDGVTQAALIPVAWTKGTDFQPVPRRPIEEITYWETWKD